jgi:electron transport complex protein RnfE
MKEFTRGLWSENPIFRIALGLCPALAITTSAANGVGMWLATTFVLVGSNVAISALRGFIPQRIRVPGSIIIIATFVTIVDLAMNAYFHPLHKALGIFIPLIAVSCIVMGRVEAYARKNGVVYSMLDGLGTGLGFTISIVAIGMIREIVGSGTLFGAQVMGQSYIPFLLVILPPGAFILLGSLLGGMNRLEISMARRAGRTPGFRTEHDCASCEIFRGWFGRGEKGPEAAE